MKFRRGSHFLLLLLFPLLGTVFGDIPEDEAVKNVLVIDAVCSRSHQIWMRALNLGLAEQNYNVTVLSCSKRGQDFPPNVHYLEMPEMIEYFHADIGMDILDMGKMNPFVMMAFFLPMFDEQDKVLVGSQGVKQLLSYPRDFKFDLMIHDYLSPHMLAGFNEYFGSPPLIAVTPFSDLSVTTLLTRGIDMPSFVPHMMKETLEDTFFDRLENFLVTIVYHFLEEYYILPKATKNFHAIAPDTTKTISEILQSSKIQMPNYHPVIDQVQPILPSVIPVGGLQVLKAKPIPEDLEEIFAKAIKGNVLFSLGSNVKSEGLGKEKVQRILDVLGEFPEYNFIWKIDITGMELLFPKNVFIRKWLPQNDILADKRTVLFISHAGGLSTQECTWFGVPMLALPVMFDQYPNSERVVQTEMGLRLNIHDLKKEEFRNTLSELLYNKKYAEKAQLMSRNYRDQPEPPMERALWWIDYVLRNPDVSFLQNQNLKNMSYFTKHSMDVVAFITTVLLVIVGIFLKTIACVIKKFRKANINVQKEKKH